MMQILVLEEQQLIIEGAMQGFHRFGELLAQLKTLK